MRTKQGIFNTLCSNSLRCFKGQCKKSAVNDGGDVEKAEEGPVDFEKAIILTGYGKFNYLLLLAVLPAGWASIYSSNAISYVLPSAECDLSLSMFDKGLLNSMPFAGMICSAFLWGFVADTFGRKKLMSYGYLCTAVISLAGCFSQSSWILILFKFFNGVLISAPYASLMSYLAEIHNEDNRSRVYMWLGVAYSLGNISIPCLAWLIIPQKWHWSLFDDLINITSWRVFLAVCSIPEFVASFAMSMFPESPRFLLSKGRSLEALEVFKKMYSINTGNHPDTYPVKHLIDESWEKPSKSGNLALIQSGLSQIKPLFLPPTVFKLMLICGIQFGATLGSNSLKLWMPQLFAMIETYEVNHPITESSGSYPSLCYMLDSSSFQNSSSLVNETIIDEPSCKEVILNSTVYINSIVIALTGVIGYTLGGTLINTVGKKKLMVFCFLFGGSCCGVLYWAEDSHAILGISAVFVALSSVGGAAVISVIVDNFPTSLRTMSVSITMMLGRVGAVVGNLLFPVLFGLGCFGPFVMIGTACLVCTLLVPFLPQKGHFGDKDSSEG